MGLLRALSLFSDIKDLFANKGTTVGGVSQPKGPGSVGAQAASKATGGPGVYDIMGKKALSVESHSTRRAGTRGMRRATRRSRRQNPQKTDWERWY